MEKFEYYVVFTYHRPLSGWDWGSRDVRTEGPLEEPDRRTRLAEALADEFPNVILVNWKRNQ